METRIRRLRMRSSSLGTTLRAQYFHRYQMVVCRLRLRLFPHRSEEDLRLDRMAVDEAERMALVDVVISDSIGEDEEVVVLDTMTGEWMEAYHLASGGEAKHHRIETLALGGTSENRALEEKEKVVSAEIEILALAETESRALGGDEEEVEGIVVIGVAEDEEGGSDQHRGVPIEKKTGRPNIEDPFIPTEQATN